MSRSLRLRRGSRTCNTAITNTGYSIPGIVLRDLDMLTHFNLTASLTAKTSSLFNLTDEETEVGHY